MAISSNTSHVSSINEQHSIYATSLISSARNHVVYVESIVNTANLPKDAQQQVASRTLAWAVQNQANAKNNYLKFVGYTALQGSLHLLRTELDLALNPAWRDSREHVWRGVRDALQNPPVGSSLESFKQVFTNTRTRAMNLTFDPAEDYITLDMSDDNLELVLSTDRCAQLSYQQAQYWLAHRIFLASSPDEANNASRSFQAVHPDKVVSKLPEYTPRSLQIAKAKGIDLLHKELSAFFKPDRPKRVQAVKSPKNLPDDLYDSLNSAGAFDSKKIPASDTANIAPAEIIQTLAEKCSVPIVPMDAWKVNQDRTSTVIIKNFDFRTQKKPELGRASYLLVGPSEKEDVRIELKSQTVSGSAADKLPMNVYRLKNMHETASYCKTIVGVTNTEFFADDTLELAKTLAATEPKLIFLVDDAVRKAILHEVQSMKLRFGMKSKPTVENASTPQSVVDLLGLATRTYSMDAIDALSLSTPVEINNDGDFGIG